MTSLVPTPPIEHSALADTIKPPSTARHEAAKSTLTIKTTPVQPVQAVVAPIAAPVATPVQTPAVDTSTLPTAAIDGCGDNQYANYIYSHESGCRLDAVNSIGCTGIGQACPGSKLTNICPNLDYACENDFFTSYAIARYGSWEGAYNFWLTHSWW